MKPLHTKVEVSVENNLLGDNGIDYLLISTELLSNGEIREIVLNLVLRSQ